MFCRLLKIENVGHRHQYQPQSRATGESFASMSHISNLFMTQLAETGEGAEKYGDGRVTERIVK